MDIVKKTAQDIKSIKIQGATNIARAAVLAMVNASQKSRASNKKSFLKELKNIKEVLCHTRPTEPLMQNSLRYLVYTAENSISKSVSQLKSLISSTGLELLENSKQDKMAIAKTGSKLIKDRMVIFTHCHSSTVTGILKEAKKQGKRFSVICTETRPLFQGHRTAKELLDSGIPTTMIVDAAISTFIKEADLVLVGSDLISTDISLVNKIGTLSVAIAAKRNSVPFFVAAELAKFDPKTTKGKIEIEQRLGNQIWPDAPKKLKILNPMFDITPRELITAFITSEGVIAPGALLATIKEKRAWVFKGR